MSSDIDFISEQDRKRPKKSEVYRLWCDNSKIKNLVNYKPKFDINLGLKKTINWISHPDNLNSYKAELYNV